jgi:hypothetical protein
MMSEGSQPAGRSAAAVSGTEAAASYVHPSRHQAGRPAQPGIWRKPSGVLPAHLPCPAQATCCARCCLVGGSWPAQLGLRSWALRSWALRSWALRSWAAQQVGLQGCSGWI